MAREGGGGVDHETFAHTHTRRLQSVGWASCLASPAVRRSSPRRLGTHTTTEGTTGERLDRSEEGTTVAPGGSLRRACSDDVCRVRIASLNHEEEVTVDGARPAARIAARCGSGGGWCEVARARAPGRKGKVPSWIIEPAIAGRGAAAAEIRAARAGAKTSRPY